MSNDKLAWILLIALSLIWGSSFILMEKSMSPVGEEQVFGPFQIGSLRVVIAGLVLLPVSIRHLKLLKGKILLWLLIVGLCGNLIPAILFTLAETKIEPSLAGILNMGTSFFVVLIGAIVYKNKPSLLQVLGVLAGAFGLYQILRTQLSGDNENIYYALFVLLATLCYGISLTTIKFKLTNVSPIAITSLSFFTIFFPALLISLFSKSYEPMINHPDALKGIGYLSVLSIVGTAFAVFVFTKLVAISSHIFASGVTYLIPVVAVFIGVLAGEKFDLFNLIWVAIILFGVYLMNKKSRKTANKTP